MRFIEQALLIFLFLATAIFNRSEAAKCYLKLNQICATNGNDGIGNELEVQLLYFNAKEDG